jgi:hypothetical protein
MRLLRVCRRLTGLVALAAFSVVAAPSIAANEPAGNRVTTVTRLVKLFLDREAALSAAMHAGDTASLERTLTDDFELRTGAGAASPIPRADFISDVAHNRPASGIANRMAVHDLDGTAIVSFVQGDEMRSAIFVVDVWRRSGTDWKLAIRYAAPAGAQSFPIPGAATPPSEIPKK